MVYELRFTGVYLFGLISFTFVAVLFYRLYIKKIYLKKQKLPFFTGYTQLIIFSIHVALLYWPYYRYSNWPHINVGRWQSYLGIGISIFGLLILLSGFIHLGTIQRIMGNRSSHLITTGIYKYSRNPQLAGYGFMMLAFAILWPSWYIVAAILSYLIFSHQMVLTEESHLQNLFRAEFYKYCQQTPRYF